MTTFQTSYRAWANWAKDAFLLRGAQDWATRLAPGEREPLRERLTAIAQKRESGEILAASEQPAEALALAEQAVELALDAATWPAVTSAAGRDDASPNNGPVWATTLAHLGASTSVIDRVGRAAEAARRERPIRNRELPPETVGRIHQALGAAKQMERLLARLVQSPRRIARRRAGRIGLAALLVGAPVAWKIRSLFLPGPIAVSASVSYDQSVHAPGKAIDGDPNTEWLLPNHATGSIEVHFDPRRLRVVHLRNSHNPPYEDRATRDFHIECWSAGKLVRTTKASFARLEPAPAVTDFPVDVPGRVDTLKIVVDSYHKSGGGLAEISWD
jgi:hypothetical protein